MPELHTIHRKLRPNQYLCGIAVIAGLILFYTITLHAVFQVSGEYQWSDIRHDDYLWHVIGFSFRQAFLSAALSLFFGAVFARAFFYQQFFAKQLILKLFSLTFVLPALVAVSGLIGIYGASGWLAKLTALLGFQWQPNIYGLNGILIAHLFFNIPLAAQMLLQSFRAIPDQQRQLAAQLNLRGSAFIRLIELPYLRQQLLPVFSLIFMLCFTSFTIVLTLGGGPKYTTLEVAIYQAVTFDFDLPKAALFAILQFIFCFALFFIGNFRQKHTETQISQRPVWHSVQSSAVRFWQISVILLVSAFLLLPLINIIWSAIFSGKLTALWQSKTLWQAIGFSVLMAPCAAFIALLMSTALLLTSRRLQWRSYEKLAANILNAGMVILAIPALVIAIGLFLLLRQWEVNNGILFVIVVFCNALAAMPFVIRTLTLPMNNNMIYYEKLCQSLNIHGWRRFRLIEWHNLARPVKYAFALACALSLGDFTAIALFGNQDFTSLPRLLYQQLGQYRSQDAAVTAFILLTLNLAIFVLLERHKKSKRAF